MTNFSFDLIIDALDIVIVSFLLYRLFALMRGTRAVSMFFGLIVLFVLSVLAQWFNLIAINWIVSSLRTVWVIAFVIIFQPELRRALAMLGQNRLIGRFVRQSGSGVIPEIVRGVSHLAEKQIGALIVLEKDMGLKNYIETGTPVDARVTSEMLETIFTPPSPLTRRRRHHPERPHRRRGVHPPAHPGPAPGPRPEHAPPRRHGPVRRIRCDHGGGVRGDGHDRLRAGRQAAPQDRHQHAAQ